MSKPPKIIDYDTGEELSPNMPVINKPSSGGVITYPGSNSNSTGGSNNGVMDYISVIIEGGKAGAAAWKSLTPEQQQKVIDVLVKSGKVAGKTVYEAGHSLGYLPDASSSLKKLFGGKSQKTQQNRTTIPSSGGSYDVVHPPGYIPTNKPTRPKPILF